MKKFLFLVVYLSCAVFNYGATLGYFTHSCPYMENTPDAVVFGLLGPLGTPAVLFCDQPMHFRLVPLSTEERRRIFMEQNGILGEQYFEENYN